MITFNDLRPKLSFVVRQEGTMVQIKPFAGYYTWLDWFDLAALDQSAAIAELTLAVEAAQADATAAGEAAATAVLMVLDTQAYAEEVAEIAIDALNDAATAQAAADAAQSLATALSSALGSTNANVNAEKHGRGSIFWDEATIVTGTKTASRIAGMDYGFAYHAGGAINNEMKVSFVADLSNGGVLHIHCVTSNGAGIATVTIDGVSVGTVDLYSVSQTPNVDKTLSLASGTWLSGRHSIHIKGATKNGLSGTYFLVITKIWFTDNNDL